MSRYIPVAVCVSFALALTHSDSVSAQDGPASISQPACVVEETGCACAPAACCGACTAGCPTCRGCTAAGCWGSSLCDALYGCRCACGCGCCDFRCCPCCQMFPHYAYYPPMHGYYYFRPYHHSHVPTQQLLVTQWGGDPRNPYSNQVFQAIYASSGKGEASPRSIPTPATLPK